MRTEKFNKPFKKDQVLSHTELNNITDAVDDVIDVLSSLDEGDHTLTDAQIEAEIKSRTDLIKDQIDADVADLNNVIDLLSSNLEGTASDLVKAKNAIGLIVLSDEHGDSIKRAAIVAAINEDGSSIAGISADKIVLDGNTTVTSKLSALDLAIAGKASAAELEALTAKVNTLNVIDSTTIGIGDFFKVYADGLAGGISIDTNGGQYPDEIDISNNGGLSIVGESEYFKVGTQNGAFNVVTSDGSQQGVGFTGTINGIKFINGICVGTA